MLLRFSDVLIVPYTELLGIDDTFSFHRGGPIWPDWDEQVEARHRQHDQVVDKRPAPPDASQRVASLAEPIAWGGAVVPLFGHQIADFSMRITATLAEAPGLPIAFGYLKEHGIDALGTTPTFFTWIMDWLGVAPGQVMLIGQPTHARELAVLPQAEQFLGPGPDPVQLDRLDALTERRLGAVRRMGRVYVSRAGHVRRLAGEDVIERAMLDAGYRVVRPETLVLADQLRALATADRVIFAEGSAMHTAQLLGRSLGDVAVLNRRQGLAVAREALEPRSTSLVYIDAVAGIVCGMAPGGQAWTAGGISVLDGEGLRSGLAASDPAVAAHLDLDAFVTARDEDVLWWIATERNHPWVRSPESYEHVQRTLAEAGLRHLADRAAAVLDAALPGVAAATVVPAVPRAAVDTPGPSVAHGGAADAELSNPSVAAESVELVRQSRYFDAGWYVATYPDVHASGIDPVVHYLRHGSREGRRPGPDFDPARYLARNPDVAGRGVDPLLHYLRHGRREGRAIG